MGKGKSPILNTMMDGFKTMGQGVGDRVRGNPRVTMVSLTAAGMAKARQYGMDGKSGDVLTYLQRNQPASIDEIHQRTQIELRTVQNIVHDLAATKPPLAIIGGAQQG